jgi:hypothetical protein
MTEPAQARRALRFTEVYLARVEIADFRRNARGELSRLSLEGQRIAC